MKLHVTRAVFLAPLLALAACVAAAPEPEETDSAEATEQLLRDVSEREARLMFEWYSQQGIDPCDPPPDPWHPFALYEMCPAVRP